MKLLSAILAILVLFLSVQPVCAATTVSSAVESCCADEACSDDADSDQQEEGCDRCNPFQSCKCCIGAVMLPQAALFYAAPAFETPAPVWSVTIHNIAGMYQADFWQPPRQA